MAQVTNSLFLAQNFHYQPQVPAGVITPPPVVIQGPLVGITTLTDLINKLLVVFIPIAVIILFLAFASGGFDLMMSQGEPAKIKKGRMKMTSALIGFGIIIFAYAIVKIVASVVGLGGSAAF